MLANGEVLFMVEMEPIMSSLPTADQLAGVRVSSSSPVTA
jgi:hypothetical protein